MNISVLCVSYKDATLVKNLINSFEYFKPSDWNIQYVVVENSEDKSFKDHVVAGLTDIVYINHEDGKNYTIANNKSSTGHGLAYELGKSHVKYDWTFVCHSDCFVTSKLFFEEFKQKVKEGFSLIGVCYDSHPDRIEAIHCSGYLVKTDILNATTMLPELPKFDTTDKVTEYCRNKEYKIFTFKNTYNDKSLVSYINEPFKSLGIDCGVDRCVAEKTNEVIYIHQGRGTSKLNKSYFRIGKIATDQWFALCDAILNKL